MKTYCKPATVNIEDWKFNELAVVECFRNKRSRKDFQRLLCKTGKITKREIVEDQLNKDFKRTLEAESEVSKMLTHKNVTTTQIYADLVNSKKRETANKISLK